MTIDPTTPEGRAEIQARAERAQAALSDIARCEFHRVTPSRHSHRQVAASQRDVPALLDALDRAEDYTKANQQIVDQCVAALDRVRELADELEASPKVGATGEEQWELDTRRVVGRELRDALDGEQ